MAASFRVLVCGGRKYGTVPPIDLVRGPCHFTLSEVRAHAMRAARQRAELITVLDKLHQEQPFTAVIVGGAAGAYLLARVWAGSRGIAVVTHEADRAKYGKGAGRQCNVAMLHDDPDLVVGFSGGKGTAHMLLVSRLAGLKVLEVP